MMKYVYPFIVYLMLIMQDSYLLTASSSRSGFFVASLTERYVGLRDRFGLGFEFGY